MSLLKTKPLWAPTAVATNLGWQDPVTKEVYVSIRNLATRLSVEHAKNVDAPVVEVLEPKNADLVVTPIDEKEEKMIDTQKTIEEVKVPAKRGPKPKVKVNEVVEQPEGVQVIGEVVEQPEGVQVIGE
jgi:Ca2+-dependent lipid-binding protein